MLPPEVAGSLQYAGVHLKTPLFVELGHTNCGAVRAAQVAAAVEANVRWTLRQIAESPGDAPAAGGA